MPWLVPNVERLSSLGRVHFRRFRLYAFQQGNHYTGTLIYTSGKNFIKITSVGMGAAKSNETR